MLPQSNRLALNLEVPAVQCRALAQLLILLHLTRPGLVARIGDARTRLMKLREQRLERPADTRECRRTLFVQLCQQALVLRCRLEKSHTDITHGKRAGGHFWRTIPNAAVA